MRENVLSPLLSMMYMNMMGACPVGETEPLFAVRFVWVCVSVARACTAGRDGVSEQCVDPFQCDANVHFDFFVSATTIPTRTHLS